jgi:hypothetical protein
MVIYPTPGLLSNTQAKILTKPNLHYVKVPPGLAFNKTFRFNDGSTNELFTANSALNTAWNNTVTGANKRFTLSFRIRKNGAIATTNFILGRDSSTTARQIVIQKRTDNKIQITLFTDSSNSVQYISGFNSADATQEILYHYVYDGTQPVLSRGLLYRDNIPDLGQIVSMTGTFTTINAITSPGIEVGGRTTASQSFVGDVSDVCLFNTNFTALQVSQTYNSGNKIDFRNISSVSSNIVCYFVAGNQSLYTAQWAWTDLINPSVVMTSVNMESTDLITV